MSESAKHTLRSVGVGSLLEERASATNSAGVRCIFVGTVTRPRLTTFSRAAHNCRVIRLRGSRVHLLGVALVIAASSVALAQPTAPHKPDIANQVVFVGLLPLKKPNGTGDLIGLKEAQSIRVVVEHALSTISRQPVFGHDALSGLLTNGYLPRWFDCRSDVSCISRVLAPVRNAGFRLAVTGDYFIKDGNYHFRLVAFSVTDGKVAKEAQFELAAADVKDEKRWLDSVAPLRLSRVGRVKIASNLGDVTCTIDGEACKFDPDGQTITTIAGEHTIELSKENYQPEKIVVSVETGSDQEVAVALKPAPTTVETPGPNGGPKVVPTSGARRAPTLTAVRTDKPIEIDGHLDDPAWQKAWLETNFTQNFPDEAKSPTERTELRVLYDDEAVYVGIRCYDSLSDKIVARLTRRDRDIEADKVTVDISSKNDRASAFHFQVNAANVQLDGTRFNDTDSSTDWDGVWYSSTSRDDKGWIAEIKIPLGALRYNGDTTSFGFQVRRYLQRRQEVDEWAYVPRDAQGEVSYYGTLEDITGLNAKRLFQISPYDSRRATFRTQQGSLDKTLYGGNIGADIKVGITPALTLDATVNPDFGTVEVDQVVLNLSTVETYFPEKRPFFIEGADLFTTPIQLFYSRRVGRSPPSTFVAGDAIEPPPDGQILAAGKLTGFFGNRLSIGVIDALTPRENTVITRMPGAAPESLLVDPLTNFGLLRLRQEFGVNSSVGFMATTVNHQEPADAAAPMTGDACPRPHRGLVGKALPVNGRCTSDAYTGGVDTVLRTDDGKWGASGQIVGSVLEKGPARRVPDGTVINPGDPGYAFTSDAGKYGGEHWLFHVHYSYMTPKLEINDAGFNGTANEQILQSYVTLRSTKKVMGLLGASLTLQANYMHYADTNAPEARGVFLNFSGTLPNFWTINARAGSYLAHYDNREARDGALLEGPGAVNYLATLTAKTDPRKSVIVSATSYLNRTTRGISTSGNITVNMRPLSFIEVDLISDASWSYGDPRWVDTETNADMSRTYYFEDLDSRSFDVLLRGTWTFSPRLSLQTYAQLYVDSGHYGKVTSANGSGAHPYLNLNSFVSATAPAGINNDFRDTTLDINVFLRWEYRPGSALWLVYTRDQLNVPYDTAEGDARLRFDKFNGPSTDVVLVKLSYLWEPLSGHH
ncbi:MAG: hypothetical protein JWO36_2866 [Myxococcales bacterium]|nr:hypothetical protein [Myxococcales bacterium]